MVHMHFINAFCRKLSTKRLHKVCCPDQKIKIVMTESETNNGTRKVSTVKSNPHVPWPQGTKSVAGKLNSNTDNMSNFQLYFFNKVYVYFLKH